MNPEFAMVLGSGLGPVVEQLEISEEVRFAAAGLPDVGVKGHAGSFLFGTLAGCEVVLMHGRIHLYEGHDARAVTQGIRWLAERGVKRLVLTNAAGTLHPERPPGTWMVIEDQLNLTGTSPLEGGPAFVDLSEIYDRDWRGRAMECGVQAGVELSCGVYAGVRGPQYETPAEVRMLRQSGADAVGMSTVLEAIQARALGMRVLGLSCLTNFAAGMPAAMVNHDDVLATGRAAATGMHELIAAGLLDAADLAIGRDGDLAGF